MPTSLYEEATKKVFQNAGTPAVVQVLLPGVAETVAVTKPFPSPVDWRDAWVYFLMVDRFNNPAAPPRTRWDLCAENRQGGNFEGIREKLPYIKELGAGAIWLTPVLKNRQVPADGSHHGYGITDFLEIDPRFGTTPAKAEEEFIRLVDEAHARGLYVIMDIVINHAGDVFAYDIGGNPWNEAGWSDSPYTVCWRDEQGEPCKDWSCLPLSGTVPRDACVWPTDFQNNDWFRRQGKGGAAQGDLQGDFCALKEFRTDFEDYYKDRPVWNLLIRAYQYAIANLDIDGFRIDTMKHVERNCARIFCNAIREFASSIGKKNFFIFGETKTADEEVLAAYTGRYTSDADGMTGADASLDFALNWKLAPAAKGFLPPTAVEDVFNLRRQVMSEKRLVSTHSEASRFFVTTLDNHDVYYRFLYPVDGKDYTRQLTLALACLFGLQGIPCVYYGTEQGLKGTRELYDPNYDPEKHGKPEHVREALWGKSNAFDQAHPVYQELQRIAQVRGREPALRYGRQYFRQISGNDQDFGFSRENGGIIAFSRILNDREVVVVANTSVKEIFVGQVLVDARINSDNDTFGILYSNAGKSGSAAVKSGAVQFYDRNNLASPGWARRIPVELGPMEIQVLTKG